jgi:hypothetical protein
VSGPETPKATRSTERMAFMRLWGYQDLNLGPLPYQVDSSPAGPEERPGLQPQRTVVGHSTVHRHQLLFTSVDVIR